MILTKICNIIFNVNRIQYNIFNKFIKRSLSLPAFKSYNDDDDLKYTLLEADFVCPSCKGSGLISCTLCKSGCLFCGYTGHLLCHCQGPLYKIKNDKKI